MRYGEVIPAVNEILNQYDFPLTVRQIYYRLISDPYNLFPNNRSFYNGFDRILVRARERGDIDEDRIEDRTRQVIGGDEGWESPEEFLNMNLNYLQDSWKDYDKKMWASQQYKLEIWLEKDALASVVSRAVAPYKVLVFPSRGFSSYTKVKEGLSRLGKYQDNDKRIYVLHLGDHDPSGLDMTRDLIDRFKKYGGSFIEVKRIALNTDQVRQFHLRPNPVKRADSRTPQYVRQYGKDCWELDALPPDELQKIIITSIENFIDKKAWKRKRKQIEDERRIVKGSIDKIMKFINRGR